MSQKKLPQRSRLGPEEQTFAIEFHQSGSYATAYDAAFPDNKLEPKEKNRAAHALLNQVRIKNYLEFLNLPAEEQAYSVLQTEIATGATKGSVDAAKKLFDIKASLGGKAVLDQWCDIMKEAGAEILVSTPGKITVDDLFKGEARIALPLAPSSGFSKEPEPRGTT